MLVDCPDCNRSYQLSADDVGERGRLLICPRCDARWFQQSARPVDDTGIGRRSWLTSADASPDPVKPISRRKPAPAATSSFPLARAIIAAGFTATLVGGAVAKRDVVVRNMPRTAAIYAAVGLSVNVRGLELKQVAASDEVSGDVTIAGEIRNVAGHRVHLPRLAFEVRDRDGAALVSWSQSSPANTLAGGRTVAFASSPHRLPPEGRTVVVRFETGDPLPIGTRAP